MLPISRIIHQLIVDLGLAEETDGSWPIYTSFLADKPHEAICVYETGGLPDGRMMRTGEKIEHKGIQIQVRGRVFPDTQQKAVAIAEALDTQGNILIAVGDSDAYLIHNISRPGTILYMGIDEKEDRRRHYFSINALVTIPNYEDFTVRITEDGTFRIVESERYLINP